MTDSMFRSAYGEVTKAVVAMRKRAGLTQRQLAAKIGRELSFVSRIEKGQRRLDLLEFNWVCRACGTDPVEEATAIFQAFGRAGQSGPKRSKRQSLSK